jgi:hypothetical protein
MHHHGLLDILCMGLEVFGLKHKAILILAVTVLLPLQLN